ncbi:TPA: protein translocase subunit SecF [Candidatus Poribacteria bacterium]|nr:protein translocase subunit SecF [Candidatus Poribacteria bacterium]HIO09191.1 protein translocase subunit SecF [Candidatus Poribacteria bacterium]HIO46457.1 protein translocase subunit SecF [Candidatus Poribacteria bacterium]
MELLKDTEIDFLGRRNIGFMLSMVLILAGIISLISHGGPRFGIDFSGGVKIRAKFDQVTKDQLKSKLTELGYPLASIQLDLTKKEAIISVTETNVEKGDISVGQTIATGLLSANDSSLKVVAGGLNISEVGPSVGKDLEWAALWSILTSILILLAYISFRFQFQFGVGAIVALIHDVLITLGIFSLLKIEINLPTVAAFLTIIGYSLNDTIVVFDRIRENQKIMKGADDLHILNKSINQSLSRTVITSLTTLTVVLLIYFFSTAGEEINTFALALIIGVLIGTYSSIFVASPIVHIWKQKFQINTPQTS